MKLTPSFFLLAFGLATAAFAGDNDKKAVAPAPEDNWEFKLSMPGWIPWMTGETWGEG